MQHSTTKRTIRQKPNIDKSIEELVESDQCYWKEGQLYQNPNYVKKFVYKPNKK